MATSTRTRRKTPDQTEATATAAPAAQAAELPAAAAPAPAPTAPRKQAAAKQQAAAKPAARKKPAPAPADTAAAAPVAPVAPPPLPPVAPPAAKKKNAARTSARSARAKPSVDATPTDAPVAAEPIAATSVAAGPAAAEQAPSQGASRKQAARKQASHKQAAQKQAARKPAARKPAARKPAADPQAEATAQAVLAVLAAPVDAPAAAPADGPAATAAADLLPAQPAPQAERRAERRPAPPAKPRPDPRPEPAPEPAPAPPPTGPAHSRVAHVAGDLAQIAWLPGHACPPALRQAAQRRCDANGHLPPGDDAALPQLLRLAQEGHHTLQVDDAVWALLAAHRDARHRLSALEAAYPDGPASAALQHLLRVPLPLFQAEGALFAVVAGRALLADERGLGKSVQAIAAAQLWHRHFGVQRVLVLCAPAQRAGWQRAWQRFAGDAPGGALDTQLVDGGHHQRQAQWSATAGVRILAPEALRSDAAHLAHWAPDLVIVDEPQQLGLDTADWAVLQPVPQALVLCGAPLADLPDLMHTLVAWLDTQRLGPLAALAELRAAADGRQQLDEADVERLSNALSRLMLQRQRADVADQLPPVVHSERLVPLAPGQRAVHDQHAAVARRLLAGWQASGWCSDSDQWRLAQALRGMQQACHRADPADPASALADATVQALRATLADLAQLGSDGGDGTGPRAAVLCSSASDQTLLAERLAGGTGATLPLLLGPGDPLPAGVDVVLQAGVPWRPRRQPAGPRGEAAAGQQWLYLVAQGSIDAGLFDTLAQRLDVPRSPADGAARGYLQGEPLQQWLQAVQAALAATPAPAG